MEGEMDEKEGKEGRAQDSFPLRVPFSTPNLASGIYQRLSIYSQADPRPSLLQGLSRLDLKLSD